jgi:hypothetical protein
MYRLILLVSIFLLFSSGLVGCGPQKSIQELNPGISFMGKNDVMKFYTGFKTESPGAIVSFKENGKASIYVKKIAKDINATWKLTDDGMVILSTQNRTDKWYIASDGQTSYSLDGTSMKIQKSKIE